MRNKEYKSLRGWLNYISEWSGRYNRVYMDLDDFFEGYKHFSFSRNGKWVNENVHLTGEQKLPIAKAIVDFVWRGRTKSDRESIAEALASGHGDLSFLQSFTVDIVKENGKWVYKGVTNGLNGDAYDYCKRKYVKSI